MNKKMREPIYFLRHGETTANEQNILSGNIDVPLTELGMQQAKEAGQIIRKEGIKFDEVHVSTLNRTKTTAVLALRECNQEDIPFIEDSRLVERDFGAFTGHNKNILKKTYGYNFYEKNLHSSSERPVSAEGLIELYERVDRYYRHVLIPRAESGKSILVVCHKYVLEMFALNIARISPEVYFDFRLPNAMPMSEEELKTYIKKESRILKEIGDRIIYHSSWIIFAGLILGFFAKICLEIPLNHSVFLLSLCLLLAISTFFVMLSLNTNRIVRSFRIVQRDLLPWYLKFIIAGCLFILIESDIISILAMLFLMPPALTVPVLSSLWGGRLYPAIEKTILLSCLAPFFMCGVLLFSASSFGALFIPFITILITSMILPAFLAQQIRMRKPIETGKFVEHWRWLGVLAVVVLAFVGTYYFTQADMIDLFLNRSKESLIFIEQGIEVFIAFAFVKIFALIASRLDRKDRPYITDLYVTHSTPNIFLWISLIALQPNMMFIGFWGCIFFFSGILIDELYLISTYKTVPATTLFPPDN